MAAKRIVIMGNLRRRYGLSHAVQSALGETVLGTDFKLGPAAGLRTRRSPRRAPAATCPSSPKLGRDTIGDMARKMYSDEGIDQRFVVPTDEHATGAAAIIIDDKKGDNAIIVFPGACSHLAPAEVDKARAIIDGAAAFMTNLELPVPIVLHGLKLARSLGTPTILKPRARRARPRRDLPALRLRHAERARGRRPDRHQGDHQADAEKAADALLAKGVKNAVITLGSQGVFIKNATVEAAHRRLQRRRRAGNTGAGDAFNGGFAVALAEGKDIVEACRFGCAVAGISVTRRGTAPSSRSAARWMR